MSKEESNNSLLYIKIFVLLLVVFLAGGIIFKLISQYQERSFTQNTYNLLVISEKYVGILGVDDSDNRFSAAIVTDELSNIKRENIMLQSMNFNIPIHGYVKYPAGKEAPIPTEKFFSFSNIKNILVNPSIKMKNINLFDWIRLYFVTEETEEQKVNINSYARISDLRALIGEEDEGYFMDSDISSSKPSLQVVNATGINGIAGRVGEMYSMVGFNVVSVISEKGLDESQVVYSDEDFIRYAQLIQKSFDFNLHKNPDYQVADVTLIIGEESELVLENLAY